MCFSSSGHYPPSADSGVGTHCRSVDIELSLQLGRQLEHEAEPRDVLVAVAEALEHLEVRLDVVVILDVDHLVVEVAHGVREGNEEVRVPLGGVAAVAHDEAVPAHLLVDREDALINAGPRIDVPAHPEQVAGVDASPAAVLLCSLC